jgi:hypothetical protein
MKRIEVVVRRSELNQVFQCAAELGIFGFDLLENGHLSQALNGGENRSRSSLKVDFAVPDADTKDTIHAVLAHAHPNSIAIFKPAPESTSTAAAIWPAHLNRLG